MSSHPIFLLYKLSIKPLKKQFFSLMCLNLSRPFHEMVFPICLKFFIDSIEMKHHSTNFFHDFSCAFLVLIITRVFMEWCMRAEGCLSAKTFPLFGKVLREKLFKNELERLLVYSSSSRSGIASHYLIELARSMESTIRITLSVLVPVCAMFIVASALLIYTHLVFSLSIVCWFSIHMAITFLTMKKSMKITRIHAKKQAILQKKLFDILLNIRFILLFGTKTKELHRFNCEQEKERYWSVKAKLYQEKIKMSFSLLCFFVLTSMIVWGSYFYYYKRLTLGDLTFILSLSFSLNGYLWYLGMRFAEVMEELGTQKAVIRKLQESNIPSGSNCRKYFIEEAKVNIHLNNL